MKSILYSTFIFMLSTFSAHSQTTYVNSNATGLNDGSSWIDAYTSLDAALNTSPTGEIWIAEGVYRPGGASADTSSMFFVNSAVDLYGGFSGTETALDQRSGARSTILSGDLMDNDDGTMDSLIRMDNTRHVVFVNSGLGKNIILDGLTIEGGQTLDIAEAPFNARAGGGIYSEGGVSINNCLFQDNFGRSGAGICIQNAGTISEQIQINNSSFLNNTASSQSAGLLMVALMDAVVANCIFEDNTTNRGCLYPQDCVNVLIQDCSFINNENPTGFGGAMFVWQTLDLTLERCEFRGNTSFQAAGMYFDAREIAGLNHSLRITDCVYQDNRATGGFGGAFTLWQGSNIRIEGCEFNRNTANNAGAITYNGSESPQFNENNCIIRNCEFGSNEAIDFGGGACYFTASSFTIDSCTFLGNISANSAGAIFSTGNNRSYTIKNSFFGLNSSNFAGAMTAYGAFTTANIENCDFLNNTAGAGGGGMNCGFKSNVRINDCSFRGGSAAVGGAISVQNDSTTVMISNTLISGNESSNSGGGLFTYTGDTNLSIYNCEISGNTTNFGGGIHISGGTDIDTSFFLASRCIIKDNTVTTQGGGINIINKDARIENCLFHNNIAESVGTGGAISHNASDDLSIELDIINTTMTQNLGLLSNGIAAWTDTSGSSTITLKNTLLDNGNDFEIEDGTPELVSAGGNFSSDVFLDLILGIDDIIGIDPLFEDANNLDFHLAEGSPCIDAGVSDGSPSTDLDGNMRDEMPDIGAYEYGSMTSNNNISLYNEFTIVPNPVEDWINLDFPERLINGLVKVYNMKGQEVLSLSLSGNNKINVGHLAIGQYLILINDDKNYRSSFIKI